MKVKTIGENRLLPRERVLEALALREPDRVPWVELEVEQIVYDKIFNRPYQPNQVPLGLYNRDVDEEKAFARCIGKDNILYSMRPPIFCNFIVGEDGIPLYGEGHLQCRDDLKKMVLPDVKDRKFYKPIERFVKNKEEFAAMATTRLGFAATYLSMGMVNFFEALYKDMDFVLQVMRRYTDWACEAMRLASDIGFDFVSASDDIAMKTGPMISPEMFENYFLPMMQKVAACIDIPWMTHSDGNMLPMMDIWLKLGQNAIHPIEPAAMDIREIKRLYGGKICLVGNVDVDILATGNPNEIDSIVHGLIRDVAPGGGYMLSSGNSLAASTNVKNALAMGKALEKYGSYPIVH